jgi:hypothetical protein
MNPVRNRAVVLARHDSGGTAASHPGGDDATKTKRHQNAEGSV